MTDLYARRRSSSEHHNRGQKIVRDPCCTLHPIATAAGHSSVGNIDVVSQYLFTTSEFIAALIGNFRGEMIIVSTQKK